MVTFIVVVVKNIEWIWIHIFFKNLPVSDKSISSADLSENNEIEELLLKKSKNI